VDDSAAIIRFVRRRISTKGHQVGASQIVNFKMSKNALPSLPDKG